MIKVSTKLSGNLQASLGTFSKRVSDDVIFSGAAAMARVIYDEVKRNVAPPRMGIKTGNLSSSIYRVYSPERSPNGVKAYKVSWNKRTAPHGHLLEFGTSRAPAKPFIRPAFDRVDEAIKAGNERMRQRLLEG